MTVEQQLGLLLGSGAIPDRGISTCLGCSQTKQQRQQQQKAGLMARPCVLELLRAEGVHSCQALENYPAHNKGSINYCFPPPQVLFPESFHFFHTRLVFFSLSVMVVFLEYLITLGYFCDEKPGDPGSCGWELSCVSSEVGWRRFPKMRSVNMSADHPSRHLLLHVFRLGFLSRFWELLTSSGPMITCSPTIWFSSIEIPFFLF